MDSVTTGWSLISGNWIQPQIPWKSNRIIKTTTEEWAGSYLIAFTPVPTLPLGIITTMGTIFPLSLLTQCLILRVPPLRYFWTLDETCVTDTSFHPSIAISSSPCAHKKSCCLALKLKMGMIMGKLALPNLVLQQNESHKGWK